MKHILKQLRGRLQRRHVLKALAIGAGIFVAVNLLVWLGYRGRTYPNVSVHNQRLGSVHQQDIPKRLEHMSLLPDTVHLTYKEKSVDIKLQDLGIAANQEQIRKEVTKASWLPLANLFGTRAVTLYLSVDEGAFEKGFAPVEAAFNQGATDAQLVLQDGRFAVKPEVEGRKLDRAAAKDKLRAELGHNKTAVELPAEVTQPQRKQAELADPLKNLQAQQDVSLTYKYQGKSKKIPAADIATWFVAKDGSFEPSDEKISGYLGQVASGFGIRAQNLADAKNAAKEALRTHKSLDFAFVPAPTVTRTYCTALRGVDASHLPGLEAKLKAVYADGRGWSLGGKLVLSHTSAGCNFTVWLSAASQMPTFGGICTSDWSCRSGPNVVINFDRWQGASAAWNQNGGTLDDYRSMVINHETGHWFGFNHSNCPGAGQPAPVMQQQSIALNGCTFNPWPLASELAALRNTLGI